MKLLIVLFLGAITAFSQPFSAGLKVGTPLTDFVDTVQSGNFNATSTTNRYIIGVTAELHLPLGLSIEGDVLYRHFSYNSQSNLVDVVTNVSAKSNAWEFPILAKYKFPSKIIRPYVDGGVAWDTLQGLSASISTLTPINGVGSFSTTTSSTSSPSELKNSTTTGIVFGAGVEVKALLIKISPEIRYTRWTSQHFTAANLLNSNQNQAEFLVGITF
jgi:hypothetical protein